MVSDENAMLGHRDTGAAGEVGPASDYCAMSVGSVRVARCVRRRELAICHHCVEGHCRGKVSVIASAARTWRRTNYRAETQKSDRYRVLSLGSRYRPHAWPRAAVRPETRVPFRPLAAVRLGPLPNQPPTRQSSLACCSRNKKCSAASPHGVSDPRSRLWQPKDCLHQTPRPRAGTRHGPRSQGRQSRLPGNRKMRANCAHLEPRRSSQNGLSRPFG